MLDWYWNLEHYASHVLLRPLILPLFWRTEARRIRHELKEKEYPFLSPEVRYARILDDLLQEAWTIMPAYNEIFLTLAGIKRFHGQELKDEVRTLEQNIVFVWDFLTKLLESPEASSVFEAEEVPAESYSSRHARCCPIPPFSSIFRFTYPPAALVKIVLLSTGAYLRSAMYKAARQAGCYIDAFETPNNRIRMEEIVYDICRTFAAIEESLREYPGALIPVFFPFVTIGFICKRQYRPWYWHKLGHFEELGSYIDPVKRMVAIFWGMPELLTKGFTSFKIVPLENRREAILDSASLDEVTKLMEEDSEDRLDVMDQEDLDLDESP